MGNGRESRWFQAWGKARVDPGVAATHGADEVPKPYRPPAYRVDANPGEPPRAFRPREQRRRVVRKKIVRAEPAAVNRDVAVAAEQRARARDL